MRAARTKWFPAFVLSFGVYLFPLIGPHTVTFLGQVIWRELTRRERESLWTASDVALALTLQIIAFAGIYWLLNKPSILRVTACVLAVPFLGVAVEYAFLIYIPTLFLIENDTEAEKGNWIRKCGARDVALIDIAHPSGTLEWSEVPLQAPDGSYHVMKIPGCEVTPLAIPQAKVQPGGRVDFTSGLTYFVPGRGVIFSKQETATGVLVWNHLFNGRVTTIPGLTPSSSPIISLDGKWAAWMEKGSVAIEPIEGDDIPLQVILGNLDVSSYTLTTVDTQRREIELSSWERRIVVGFDGKVKSSGSQALVWDRYRENGLYRVSWTANTGVRIVHDVLKGRSINAAAMSPSGNLVAVSVTTALNIGDIRDSIYVLQTKDGTEVFRRYLPKYTRTPVWFSTDDSLVYTGDREVIVLNPTP